MKQNGKGVVKANAEVNENEAIATKSLDEVFNGDDVFTSFMNELALMSEKEFKAKLDSLKQSVEVTADYLDLPDGSVMRCLYAGETTFSTVDNQNNPAKLPAIKLIGEDKRSYITAAVVLVNSIKSLPMFTPLEVIQIGKAQGKRYINYKVTVLTAVRH